MPAGIELQNRRNRGADVVERAEGHHGQGRCRVSPPDPAQSETRACVDTPRFLRSILLRHTLDSATEDDQPWLIRLVIPLLGGSLLGEAVRIDHEFLCHALVEIFVPGGCFVQ
jgi:hypothetical protein